jgi:hypothetical protein
MCRLITGTVDLLGQLERSSANMIQKIQQLEPSFCPLHNQVAPCLYCLVPQVAQIVTDSKNETSRDGVLFEKADLNSN